MTNPVDRLGLLDSLGSGQLWRTPDQLRRTGNQRRRRKVTVLAGTAAVLAAALVLTLVEVNSEPASSPVRVAAGLHAGGRSGPALQLVSDAAPLAAPAASAQVSAQAVAQAEQAFAVSLLQQASSERTAGNVVLSPSSLSIALAMLQNGAIGQTRAEIAKVLHTSALSNQQQDAGWASLSADLTGAAKQGYTLESANSLWLQQNLPMQQPFMDAMARYFQAGVWQVDFVQNLAGATKAINGWVKDQTHGKITKLFNDGDIDQSTALVLANAVYFTAKWKYQFDTKLTADGNFTGPDDATTSVPFMSLQTKGATASVLSSLTAGYQAVQLPFAGDRLAALMIMPGSGSLSTFVANLDTAELQRITASLRSRELNIRIPKLHLEHYTELNSTLKSLGMPRAFSELAEFSALSPVPLHVQAAGQRDYLDVDEAGTEAAAVTGISGAALSAGSEPGVSFDRPFLFLIRDTVTGTILFSAEVQHPQS